MSGCYGAGTGGVGSGVDTVYAWRESGGTLLWTAVVCENSIERGIVKIFLDFQHAILIL
jgi:hypothetical protein